MVELPSFSENWPYRVLIKPDVDVEEAYAWLLDRMDQQNTHGRALYTSFSNRDWGFKEKALAMEFKLRFG